MHNDRDLCVRFSPRCGVGVLLAVVLVACQSSGDDGMPVDPCSAYAGYAGTWQCMGGAEPLTTCSMTVAYNDLAGECALKCLFTACFSSAILDQTTDANGRVVHFTCDNGFPNAPIDCSRP